MDFELCDSEDVIESTKSARRPKRLSPHNFAAGFAIFDAVTIVVVGFAFASFVQGSAETTVFSLQERQIWGVLFVAGLQFGLGCFLHLYRTTTIFDRDFTVRRAALSFLGAFAFMVAVAAATKSAESYSRLWFFSWVASSLACAVIARVIVMTRVRRALREEAFVYRALSVGVFCDPLHPREIERRSNHEENVVGRAKFEDLAALVDLSERIVLDEIDHVYLATPWAEIPTLLSNLHLLRHLSTRIFVLPADRRVLADVVSVAKFGDRISYCAMQEPIHGWSLWFKRVEDIVIAGGALLVLAPLMALAATAIKLDSPGPIIFRQPRVGFNGRTFELWKFRSMFAEQTDLHASVQTSRNDPRVTRVGRFIRGSSIDELPQLFNVLRGEMSIVGPRPHALSTRTEGHNLEELVDYYAVRHRVKPGMTGWAQVRGFRGELDTLDKLQNRVDCDLYYIDNWTFWLDIDIVIRTVMMIFRDKRAY
jgi:Undecaprenyl-phosphate glucose phosphotransferase